MSTTAILAITIPILLVLAVILVAVTSRRRDSRTAGALSREAARKDRGSVTLSSEETATGREVELAAARARAGTDLAPVSSAPLAPWVPPDAEQMGVTRRQFYNRSMIALMGLSLSGFGAAVLAFLWPKLGAGFGAKINIGNINDVKASIRGAKGFYYVPAGRAWITEYPKADLDKAKKVYQGPVFNGQSFGINALYQKCPHLGCRVPSCATSQWFECPCHGSQYNQVGEKKGGPAPRGMDRFGVSVDGAGNVVVDTGTVFPGPPIGTNTTGQEAEGPHCIGSVGEHK